MRTITVLSFLLLAQISQAGPLLSLTVSAGKQDRVNEPVVVPLGEKTLPGVVELRDAKDQRIAFGQFIPNFGLSPATRQNSLVFLLPALAAGKELQLQVVDATTEPGGFRTEKMASDWTLSLDGRPVLKTFLPRYDTSSPQAREQTFKVFHHLYDPAGKQLITKGSGGQFTHHRGLFFGFMKCTYGKNTVDIWHCKDKTHQAHLDSDWTAGPVLAQHRARISWNGVAEKPFATEERYVTVFNVPGGTLVEFASRVTPTEGTVKLDGDPQHAGFHFRASNEVSEKTKNQTIFVRPHGVGKPGTERNWPREKDQVNLPWLAMSFVVGGQRYTACYLDRPDNPKEARFSERTYGRFGSYFVTTITPQKPLVVRYRIWLQEGEMKPEQVAARDLAFVDPVSVKVK